MDLSEFKSQYYFFNPVDYGRIFVFVDFGNVRPWAKEMWPEVGEWGHNPFLMNKKTLGPAKMAEPRREYDPIIV